MATDGVPKPERIHLDIASLAHNAPEKVSQTADIEAMCAVISKAGAAIFGDRKLRIDNGPVAVWRRNLRYQFSFHKLGLRRVPKIGSRIRVAPIRFIALMLRKVAFLILAR